jgi:hypothetical protein
MYSELSLKDDNFKRGVNAAIPGMQRMGAIATSSFALIAVGAAAAGKAYLKAVDDGAALIASVDDIADRFGVTTKEAGALKNIMNTMGIESSTLNMAFKTLSQNGIAPTLDGLLQAKARLDATGGEAERTALTVKLLGRSGLELAETLRLDNAQLAGYIKNARDSSFVTDKMTDAQDAYTRSLAEYKNIAMGANVIATQSGLVTKDNIMLAWEEGKARDALRRALATEGIPAYKLANMTIQEQVDLLQRLQGAWKNSGQAIYRASEQERAAVHVSETLLERLNKLGGMHLNPTIAVHWDEIGGDEETKRLLATGGASYLYNIQTIHRITTIRQTLAGLEAGYVERNTSGSPDDRNKNMHNTWKRDANGNWIWSYAQGGRLPTTGVASVGEAGEEGIIDGQVIPHAEWMAMKKNMGAVRGFVFGGGKGDDPNRRKTSTGGTYSLDGSGSRFAGTRVTNKTGAGLSGGESLASVVAVAAEAASAAAAGVAVQAAQGAASGVAMQIPTAVAQQTREQNRILAETGRSTVTEIRRLGDRIVNAVRDGVLLG